MYATVKYEEKVLHRTLTNDSEEPNNLWFVYEVKTERKEERKKIHELVFLDLLTMMQVQLTVE